MPRSVAAKRAAFRALHETGCFLLPNPWDAGSARMLQHMGFAALASTSAGYAWSMGQPDYAVTCDGVVDHLTMLCAAVDLPVNADFEGGFATAPESVATNTLRAVQAGVAGLSIEDRDFMAPHALYDPTLATERIRAVRAALDGSGHDVILVARTEGLLVDPTALTPAIDRLTAFAAAGADCLYAPGVRNKADIAAMVRAVAPKPLNVLMVGQGLSLAEMADLGVRRISVGGALARMAWSGMMIAAEQMQAASFNGFAGGAPGQQLNTIFKKFVST